MLNYDDLVKNGLTNNLFDYSELTDNEVYKEYKTYCSSWACAKNSMRKNGTLVEIGDIAVKVCPKCNSDRFIVHQAEFKRRQWVNSGMEGIGNE